MQCNILLNRNMRQLKYYVHQLFVFRFTYMGNLLTKMSNILLFPKYIYIIQQLFQICTWIRFGNRLVTNIFSLLTFIIYK